MNRMMMTSERRAILAAYRDGEPIKIIVERWSRSRAYINELARQAGLPRRHVRLKPRGPPLQECYDVP